MQVYSDKNGIRILVDLLASKGVCHAVLSPGSRNAPLLVSFARETRIKHYVIVDERSAAYFALGMAQQSRQAVALICTSGTALLNYAPALAEAYYQKIPLIVISADRPLEWIDQDDSQTIRQNDVMRNFIKSSYTIPAEPASKDELWYVNRTVNDAYNLSMCAPAGPVHINVPLSEPLYGHKSYAMQPLRMVGYENCNELSEQQVTRLASSFNHYKKILILAGFYPQTEKLKDILQSFSQLNQVVIMTENISHLDSPAFITTVDRVLATIPENELSLFSPDLLITFGGAIVSKRIKNILRQYSPTEHWGLDERSHIVDLYQSLTHHIPTSPDVFFDRLFPNVQNNDDSEYKSKWMRIKDIAMVRHNEYVHSAPWCDLKAFSILFPALPANSYLQLSNGTCIRYAQLFNCAQISGADANRGTSGIDGSTSTAIGAAMCSQEITTLITGDISFMYDSGALWIKYIPKNMRIIVIKNGGGAIFRFIPGPASLEELEECFETAQDIDVAKVAALHNLPYFEANNEIELQTIIPGFYAQDTGAALLAINTPRFENDKVLREYFSALHQNKNYKIN